MEHDHHDGAPERGGLSLNIGAVARATGVPESTLRTWERRYGFPTPARSEAGQRLYSSDVVHRIRLVARALDLGHRPRQVVGAEPAELRRLLGESTELPVEPAPTDERVADWVDAARTLDGGRLRHGLHTEAARLGLVAFARDRVAPFLASMGDAWAAGRLGIYHEHFASEVLHEFLVDAWRPMSDAGKGPTVVLATMPGEHHDLGLHLAAAVVASNGYRVLFLGPDTPPESVAEAARQAGARAVLVSVSAFASPSVLRAHLANLRAQLDREVDVVLGGAGAPADVAGTRVIADLGQLAGWRAGEPGFATA